ncbi:MAG: CHRD domain-containing protein [Gemmatimonadales bacterium]|nr:MAG: CHRD domain-containing protein [Gemmatimonadales bacterium]
MHTPRKVFLLAAAVVIAGCTDTGVDPAPVEIPVLLSQHQGPPGHARAAHNFGAPLSGAQEVPPAATRARGNAIFRLSADGTELSFRLIVANIENVTMAHIHCAPAGVNGPVVVWLYPLSPPAQLIPGRTSGILSEGTVTGVTSNACGATLTELVDRMRAGDTYVNVHTAQFPPGEIRGQIRGNGPS